MQTQSPIKQEFDLNMRAFHKFRYFLSYFLLEKKITPKKKLQPALMLSSSSAICHSILKRNVVEECLNILAEESAGCNREDGSDEAERGMCHAAQLCLSSLERTGKADTFSH